ncbi:hypothetical protein AN958_07793 [Leucoagaricus sp. SymC.cos]|nr:hypothetical protein AN958_07793 [Leucoagaricus sp. SymC.cos]
MNSVPIFHDDVTEILKEEIHKFIRQCMLAHKGLEERIIPDINKFDLSDSTYRYNEEMRSPIAKEQDKYPLENGMTLASDTPVEGRQVEFGARPSVIVDTIRDAMKGVLKSYLDRIFSLNLDTMHVREESTAIDLTREALMAQEQPYLHNRISDFFRTKELKKGRTKYEKLKSAKVLVFCLEIPGHLWSEELWRNGLTGDAVKSKEEWEALAPANQRSFKVPEPPHTGKKGVQDVWNSERWSQRQEPVEIIKENLGKCPASEDSVVATKKARTLLPTAGQGTRTSPFRLNLDLSQDSAVSSKSSVVPSIHQGNQAVGHNTSMTTPEISQGNPKTASKVASMGGVGPTSSNTLQVQQVAHTLPVHLNLSPSMADIDKIKKTLKSCGSTTSVDHQRVLAWHTEQVQFWPIKRYSWDELMGLIEEKKSPYDIAWTDCGLGIISYDLWEVLGQGGMKIAIKAMFHPQPPEKNSIYPLLQEEKMIVALKRPIIKKLSPGKKPVMKVRPQFGKKAIEDFKLFPSTDENVERAWQLYMIENERMPETTKRRPKTTKDQWLPKSHLTNAEEAIQEYLDRFSE